MQKRGRLIDAWERTKWTRRHNAMLFDAWAVLGVAGLILFGVLLVAACDYIFGG